MTAGLKKVKHCSKLFKAVLFIFVLASCRSENKMRESVLHEASPTLDTKSPEWCQRVKYKAVKSECAKNAYHAWLEDLDQGLVVHSDLELLETQKKCFEFAKLIFAREVHGDNFRREEMEFRAKCIEKVNAAVASQKTKSQKVMGH